MKELFPGVWHISAGCNVYYIEAENTLIDTGARGRRLGLDTGKVARVFLTHLHYDHSGNAALFTHAMIYAGLQAILDFGKEPAGAVLDDKTAGELRRITLHPLKTEGNFTVIPSPGHTRGSVCILYKDILFSGDTLFFGAVGRTDLPTSDPQSMQKTLDKLGTLKFSYLCPGHGITGRRSELPV